MGNTSVIRDLKAMGFRDEQIRQATVNGKSLEDAVVESKRPAYWPYQSKAEMLFADELESRRLGGVSKWWAYEPVTLVIVDAEGKRCRYTPDFMELTISGLLNFYEVKGFLRTAARVRFLAARERYPFWTFTMVRRYRGRFEVIL